MTRNPFDVAARCGAEGLWQRVCVALTHCTQLYCHLALASWRITWCDSFVAGGQAELGGLVECQPQLLVSSLTRVMPCPCMLSAWRRRVLILTLLCVRCACCVCA
jgi:hypothetical protein